MATYEEMMAMPKAALLEKVRAEGITWATMRWSKDDLARQLVKEEARRREDEWLDKNAARTI